MGSIGEPLARSGDHVLTLWCDLTRDTHLFSISVYKNGEFVDLDEGDNFGEFMASLQHGKWTDRFGNASRESEQGTVIFEWNGHVVTARPRWSGWYATFEFTLIVDGTVEASHELLTDKIASNGYSKIFNALMARSEEEKKWKAKKKN